MGLVLGSLFSKFSYFQRMTVLLIVFGDSVDDRLCLDGRVHLGDQRSVEQSIDYHCFSFVPFILLGSPSTSECHARYNSGGSGYMVSLNTRVGPVALKLCFRRWFAPAEAASFCSRALLDSMTRALTFSFGSICFGSFLVALVQALRALERHTRDSEDMQILSCIIQCILSWYVYALVSHVSHYNLIGHAAFNPLLSSSIDGRTS